MKKYFTPKSDTEKIVFYIVSAFLCLTIIFNLSSCKKKLCCALPANLNFKIFVQNAQSQDLLNPQTKDAYPTDDVKVFYLNNGKKELAFEGNLDHPQFWDIAMDSISGNYFLSVRASNHRNSQGQSTTLIQWKYHDTDTTVCQFRGDGHDPIKKIWYNGTLVWDGYQPADTIRTVATIRARIFTITK